MREFPECLNNMPLLPGEDFAVHARLMQWLHRHVARVHVIGEFDDSAMLKAFGQSGAGLFFAPAAIADAICAVRRGAGVHYPRAARAGVCDHDRAPHQPPRHAGDPTGGPRR
jgi:hypothetical protein